MAEIKAAEPKAATKPAPEAAKFTKEDTRLALEDVMRHLGQAGGNAQAVTKLQAVIDKLK